MYQVYGQTETLPVAMMGTRPQFAKDVPDENNKPATSDGSMRTTTSGSTESTTHDDPKRGETSCVVICVKPEAAVTEKELVEFCFVHLGNCKRPGKVCCVTIPCLKRPCLKRPSARSSARSCARRSGSVASGGLQATDRYALPRRRG
jgi:acyl-CoA synthetase (AMP-forming)/AMP-acid ligase II